PERQQMLAQLADREALIARLTTEATQSAARRAEDAAVQLAEQDALAARWTTEITHATARQAEDAAALRQVHALTADLARQLSAAFVALDRAHTDARAQGDQMAAMTTELAALGEDSRMAQRSADAERDRAEALRHEIVAL